MDLLLFTLLGVMAVGLGIAMILSRNPVYSALYLIGCLIAIAGEFMLLGAAFLAALQVLVYAGAIMVLYLFVVMLLNLRVEAGFRWWTNWRTYAGISLTGIVTWVALRSHLVDTGVPAVRAFGTDAIAERMFSNPAHILVIEALAVLLLMAVVGALYLGRRPSPTEDGTVEGEA
jgi:NADH-quinone oxidoreductase subunit J